MPFTLSHPGVSAVFWPLVRRNYLPLCALAIGAMSPDFEYLWRLRTEWRWSHAPLGILTFCVPVGLVTALVWVAVVRDPVRRLLTLPPAALQLSAAWWIRAAIAIGLGAATHLVWDGFTHGSRWATTMCSIELAALYQDYIGLAPRVLLMWGLNLRKDQKRV